MFGLEVYIINKLNGIVRYSSPSFFSLDIFFIYIDKTSVLFPLLRSCHFSSVLVERKSAVDPENVHIHSIMSGSSKIITQVQYFPKIKIT